MATLNSTCTICNAPDAKRCSTCHSTSYCSPACQKKDWSLHKTLCKDYISILSTRPSPSHKLALILPVSSTLPQYTWLFISLTRTPNLDALLSAPATAPREYAGPNRQFIPLTQSWDPNRRFEIKHTVGVYVRDTFALDGSQENACVVKITGGKMGHEWRGPVVVTRLTEEGYGDVGLGDLRVCREYLRYYGRE